MFIHKISTQVVGVNGKHPRIKYQLVVAAVVVAVVAWAVAVAVVAKEVGKCIKLQKWKLRRPVSEKRGWQKNK